MEEITNHVLKSFKEDLPTIVSDLVGDSETPTAESEKLSKEIPDSYEKIVKGITDGSINPFEGEDIDIEKFDEIEARARKMAGSVKPPPGPPRRTANDLAAFDNFRRLNSKIKASRREKNAIQVIRIDTDRITKTININICELADKTLNGFEEMDKEIDVSVAEPSKDVCKSTGGVEDERIKMFRILYRSEGNLRRNRRASKIVGKSVVGEIYVFIVDEVGDYYPLTKEEFNKFFRD